MTLPAVSLFPPLTTPPLTTNPCSTTVRGAASFAVAGQVSGLGHLCQPDDDFACAGALRSIRLARLVVVFHREVGAPGRHSCLRTAAHGDHELDDRRRGGMAAAHGPAYHDVGHAVFL